MHEQYLLLNSIQNIRVHLLLFLNPIQTHILSLKNVLYNNRVLSLYNRYVNIKDEYKNTFFKEMKKTYLSIIYDEDLFSDFMENLSENNKKIFIQVLSTDNSDDFELLRKTYGSIIKNPGDK